MKLENKLAEISHHVLRSQLGRILVVCAAGANLLCSNSWAAQTTGATKELAQGVSPLTGLFQILFGLVVVLAIMAFAAWSFKKIGPMSSTNRLPVKIIGGVSVGNREKIMVVEIADQWIVVGVTASQINTLSTMDKQTDLLDVALAGTVLGGRPQGAADHFATWLKRTMDKRNAQTDASNSTETGTDIRSEEK